MYKIVPTLKNKEKYLAIVSSKRTEALIECTLKETHDEKERWKRASQFQCIEELLLICKILTTPVKNKSEEKRSISEAVGLAYSILDFINRNEQRFPEILKKLSKR